MRSFKNSFLEKFFLKDFCNIVFIDGKIKIFGLKDIKISFEKGIKIFIEENFFKNPIQILFFISSDKILSDISFYFKKKSKIFFRVINISKKNEDNILKNNFLKNKLSFFLEKGASVESYFLKEDLQGEISHFIKAFLKKDSFFKITTFSKKISDEKLDFLINLEEENAKVNINSLNFLEKDNKSFLKISVNHKAEKTDSFLLFKSLEENNAHFNYNALVTIDKNAKLSKSTQLNKNLLFGKKSSVVSKPLFDVHVDDVKVNHGSNIYLFDEEELFFLRSKGLSKKLAKLIKIKGFCKEIIDLVKIEKVKNIISERF